MQKDKHQEASLFKTQKKLQGNHIEKEKNIRLLEARRPGDNAFENMMAVILKLQFCPLPNWKTNISTE